MEDYWVWTLELEGLSGNILAKSKNYNQGRLKTSLCGASSLFFSGQKQGSFRTIVRQNSWKKRVRKDI